MGGTRCVIRDGKVYTDAVEAKKDGTVVGIREVAAKDAEAAVALDTQKKTEAIMKFANKPTRPIPERPLPKKLPRDVPADEGGA
ncbi:MAG: hypothetical protein GY716_10300 [bacterium]|nr:hypothetical protein [bacterium]